MTLWLIFFVPVYLLVGWCCAILHRIQWPSGDAFNTILWLTFWPLMVIGSGVAALYDLSGSWGPTDAAAHRIRRVWKGKP